MHHLKLKDKKIRHLFQKFELKFKLRKFIFTNLLNTVNISVAHKKIILYRILKKKKRALLTKVTRRCLFTNKSKSLRFSKLSRIQSRELISFGVLPGYKKAVW